MIDWVRRLVAGRVGEERNVRVLAARLGVAEDDARWLLRRAHEVGFGAAMTEFEARCRERAAAAAATPRGTEARHRQ